jgi:hypothetical protein
MGTLDNDVGVIPVDRADSAGPCEVTGGEHEWVEEDVDEGDASVLVYCIECLVRREG